jgi:hypothetical protein
MRRAFFIFAGFIVFSTGVFAQPGPEGYLSVNVVDGSGNPIPDARVLEAQIAPGRMVIEGYNKFDNSQSRYKPRDAERSSFVARIVCGERYSIAVSAAGYESVIKENAAPRTCPAEVTVVLERTYPRPAYPKKLITVSGQIKNQNGISMDGWLRIFEDNKEYIPKIEPDGTFSAKLSAGTYQIKLEHHRCNQFLINNYRVGPEPKTLDLDADCK